MLRRREAPPAGWRPALWRRSLYSYIVVDRECRRRLVERFTPELCGFGEGEALVGPPGFGRPAWDVAGGWSEGGAVDPEVVGADESIHRGGVCFCDGEGEVEIGRAHV